MVRLHRRDKGMSGIYYCVIPDQCGINQTLYVVLYAITIQESGKQTSALHMSDRKHHHCFVSITYLWILVDHNGGRRA